ncbi:uncharacterized protein LOC110686885 [Chenopodium quinoa]|uniref:uncharacterized protein LOC110686885 n=1 Tax=Chenopodium quinoa TaxID=63459 RepID=UPI000B780A5E|nr:uncharacterized protein LOC110686885 [Chenopodium quinoa]
MTLNPDFNFHPRCSKLGITHMMYADDLLLLSRANIISIQLVFQAFQKFSSAANLDKSDVYFGGISKQVQTDLRSVLGVAKCSFPFKYLDVPLSSKKVTISHCRPLVEIVTARIKEWATRHLSYDGRLQLNKSVLFAFGIEFCSFMVIAELSKDSLLKCNGFYSISEDLLLEADCC